VRSSGLPFAERREAFDNFFSRSRVVTQAAGNSDDRRHAFLDRL